MAASLTRWSLSTSLDEARHYSFCRADDVASGRRRLCRIRRMTTLSWMSRCRLQHAILSQVSALVLINGAPGAGKSTVASLAAAQRNMALALDIDLIKHSLGCWDADPYRSGVQARRLAVAMIRQHLQDGHDVFLGQYLARADFIVELEQLAHSCDARFVETVLRLGPDALAERIAQRHRSPSRVEHAVNNALVGADDAPLLVDSISAVLDQRPNAVVIDAAGEPELAARAIGGLVDEV